MLKKLCLILLFCFATPSLSSAEYLAEVKVGYFRPLSDTLRDVFPDGWPNYQIELSYSPFDRCNRNWWKRFFAWGSVNFIHIHCKCTSGLEHATVDFIPAAAGLKYMIPLPCCTQMYASAGFKYFWLNINNRDGDLVLRDRARGLGSVFAIGALFHPLRNLFFDFFVDYSFKHFDKSNFQRRENNIIPTSVDISGFTVGVGAGIWF